MLEEMFQGNVSKFAVFFRICTKTNEFFHRFSYSKTCEALQWNISSGINFFLFLDEWLADKC